MLARLERPNRPFAMHGIRQRDVDGIHLTVGEHLLITGIGFWNPELLREIDRQLPPPRTHRRSETSLTNGQSTAKLPCNVACSQNPPGYLSLINHFGSIANASKN